MDGHDEQPHGYKHKRNHNVKRHHIISRNEAKNAQSLSNLHLQQPRNNKMLIKEHHHMISGVEFPALKNDKGKHT